MAHSTDLMSGVAMGTPSQTQHDTPPLDCVELSIPEHRQPLVALDYRDETHRSLPHVVKFSGGRSSAAMLLSLCRAGLLDQQRRDVVLFANTGAEHPATYEFASRVCDEVEQRHGIPCLWYEFCTVEDAGIRGWRRYASYRLVARRPASDDDLEAVPGFRSNGEPFEELASWKAMLPNRYVRLCTQYLKTISGAMLIADWLGGGPGPPRAGHSHEQGFGTPAYLGTRMSVEAVADMRHFVNSQPVARPRQDWTNFTDVPVDRSGAGSRPRADVWGRRGHPVHYVALLGLRADESDRVDRMLLRGFYAEGATSSACRDASQPAGECDYAPLADGGATKTDVMAFWSDCAQGYDLGIDGRLGNCVYCFMKGEPALAELARAEMLADSDQRFGSTPSNIRWWSDLEQRYAGPSDDGGRFKFLSLGSSTYADIAESNLAESSVALEIGSRSPSVSALDDGLLHGCSSDSAGRVPCECTD